GWARAPKLEVKPASVQLRGQIGQTLQATVTVFSQERRPIYAYGACDQPWLDVGRAKFEAKNPVAKLPVQVRVPNRPGETLQANIRVTGNGNQRFTVPLSLAVEGNPFDFGSSTSGDDLVPVVSVEPGIVVDEIEPLAAVTVDTPEPLEVIEAAALTGPT